MKKLVRMTLPLSDIVLVPAVYVAGHLLKLVRRVGVDTMPFCKRVLMHVGVFPIRNHFHEPLFDSRLLRHSLDQDREIPGLDLNVDEQLQLLNSFAFADELKDVPVTKKEAGPLEFHLNNGSFARGDADYWYNLIRFKKPSRIFEIGSGNSTRMAIKAIEKNREEDPDYQCKHVCIEPYKQPWLEQTEVTVIRQIVEEVDKSFFLELEENDILFIDSSHVIRPQGDVLFEYLELLPILKPGVIVHAHDVFTPRDYVREKNKGVVCFWNEQYLLEAFLTNNNDWKVIGAVNYLYHNHHEQLKAVCPLVSREYADMPGSFYIQKRS